jgi:hypothetical protein
MTYRGTILNGVVVFDGAERPADGTQVEIHPVASAGQNGSRQPTVDDIALQQGVTSPARFDQLVGGWPEGEQADGFEDAVARWRGEEPRRAEF